MTASALALPQPTREEMPTELGMADAGATCGKPLRWTCPCR